MSVLLAKRKWPDRPHYDITVTPLGRDEHGLWLASHVGSTVCRGGEPLFDLTRDALHLMPAAAGVWWTVWFARDWETYVDICLPAVIGDDEISFIDLDLDVILHEGVVRIDDEDELVAHSASLAYPPHLVIGARAAAAAVRLLLEERRGPFAPGVTDRWWAALDG